MDAQCDKLATKLSWYHLQRLTCRDDKAETSPILTYAACIWRPLWMTPLEFCHHLWCQKSRVSGLSCGIVSLILCLAIFVELQLVTDRRTVTKPQHVPGRVMRWPHTILVHQLTASRMDVVYDGSWVQVFSKALNKLCINKFFLLSEGWFVDVAAIQIDAAEEPRWGRSGQCQEDSEATGPSQ